MEVSQEVKIEPPYDPAIAYMGIYLKKDKNTNSKRYMQASVHRSIFITAEMWKQSKCPSGMNDKAVIYILEYYSVITKNDVLPFAATWIDLKGIMLSEVSQRKTNTV